MVQQCTLTFQEAKRCHFSEMDHASYLTKMDWSLQIQSQHSSKCPQFLSHCPLAWHLPLHAPLSNNLQSSACPKSIWHCTCRNPGNFHNKDLLRWCDRFLWQNWRTHPRKALQLPSIFQQSLASPSAASPTKPQFLCFHSKNGFIWAAHCTTVREEHGWLTEFCLLRIQTFQLQGLTDCDLWNFSNWQLFQSSNFSSGPFKHRSKRSYLARWKTKLLDPGTTKMLGHPRIELAFSINRLQGSNSFTFSFGRVRQLSNLALPDIESASQTCGLSFLVHLYTVDGVGCKRANV